MFDTVIAIDPGASGGIVVYRDKRVTCHRMPGKNESGQMDIDALLEFLKHLKSISQNPLCFIERVMMWRGEGDEGGKKFGITKMLANQEQLKTGLAMVGIPYIQVASVSWQKFHGLQKGKDVVETDTQKKNRFKEWAQNIFTHTDVKLWNADALLILAFGINKIDFDKQWIYEKLPKLKKMF